MELLRRDTSLQPSSAGCLAAGAGAPHTLVRLPTPAACPFAVVAAPASANSRVPALQPLASTTVPRTRLPCPAPVPCGTLHLQVASQEHLAAPHKATVTVSEELVALELGCVDQCTVVMTYGILIVMYHQLACKQQQALAGCLASQRTSEFGAFHAARCLFVKEDAAALIIR